ncbi:HTH-type transcriptional repressor YtrA [bioreactor metagenome]|uniref:HTH-type transcriptional repressor YtrA n=1 Tax=bioreactor metagenome TaxID=1076179 RepID=A0A644ZV67_9ZZZZ|nr:GntR family transcriptional regulator [Oscillospiraceae bacterium]
MITVDFKDRRPIYEQIASNIKLLISTGVLNGGDKLPSVRSLSLSLGINPNTIMRAYTELEREGIAQTVQGKGVFISEDVSSIKEKQREEIKSKLDQLVCEAEGSGISKQTLNQWLSVSPEGSEKNKNDNDK